MSLSVYFWLLPITMSLITLEGLKVSITTTIDNYSLVPAQYIYPASILVFPFSLKQNISKHIPSNHTGDCILLTSFRDISFYYKIYFQQHALYAYFLIEKFPQGPQKKKKAKKSTPWRQGMNLKSAGCPGSPWETPTNPGSMGWSGHCQPCKATPSKAEEIKKNVTNPSVLMRHVWLIQPSGLITSLWFNTASELYPHPHRHQCRHLEAQMPAPSTAPPLPSASANRALVRGKGSLLEVYEWYVVCLSGSV